MITSHIGLFLICVTEEFVFITYLKFFQKYSYYEMLDLEFYEH